MAPITLEELAAAIDGIHAIPAAGDLRFDRIVFDPESVRRGDLYWQLPARSGPTTAGALRAESRGALAVVASRADTLPGRRRILVPDSNGALERFAAGYRSLLDACVLGVCGGDPLLAADLANAALGRPPARAVQDMRGLWENLSEFDFEDHFGVVPIESGPDNSREHDSALSLLGALRPDAAIIAEMPARVAQFPTAVDPLPERVLDTLPRGGFAVLPGDGAFAAPPVHRGRSSTLFVGHGAGNTHRVVTDAMGAGRLRFRVDRFPFEIHSPGRHFSIPAGMAVVAARHLGRRDPEIASDLESFQPAAGQGNVAVDAPWTIIDEATGSRPRSLRAACRALAEWPCTGRRILVTDSPLAEDVAAVGLANRSIDTIALLNTSARQVAPEARRAGMDAPCLAGFTRPDDLSGWLQEMLRPGDLVWVVSTRMARLAGVVAELVAFSRRQTPLDIAA